MSKHGFAFTRSQVAKLKKVAAGTLESATLNLSPEQLEGDHTVKLTKAMKKKVEAARTAGEKIRITFDKPMVGQGFWTIAQAVAPIVQEALKDDSTDRLLERLERLRGSGVDDDAWKTFGDSFKFVFTNPTEAVELLTGELGNLLKGDTKASEKVYRLPPGVDYTKGMDYKKVGTRIK